VDEKSRIGDWEIVTVIGKGHSGSMVTIVERATQFSLVAKVPNKSAEAVTATTIELLKPYIEALTQLQRIMARSSHTMKS
jgi:IS30 family transposase